MSRLVLIQLAYFAASTLFIFGLKAMNSPRTARRGMMMAAWGMVIAMVGAMADSHVQNYLWIGIGVAIGTVVGVVMAMWTPMTHMPQRTALSHAFGALAVSLVGAAHFYDASLDLVDLNLIQRSALGLEVVLGSLTVTGSLLAFAKLHEWIKGNYALKGQNYISLTLAISIILLTVYTIFAPSQEWAFYLVLGLSLIFGVFLVAPIGAADMPVVIALLNSYAGLGAAATGFALNNNILIIAGALDGASGLILAVIMSKAMNRPLMNVIFGKIQATTAASADDVYGGKVKSTSAEEIALMLGDASRVVIVPGYGMAVAQAQHAVRDLFRILEKRGCRVDFAIHPVAGRMPGHMNVLLAEADIPFDHLIEMDAINPTFDSVDVAIVIGANDVVNPDARNANSPIAGMPILEVDRSRSVVNIKRSLSPGFAGIPNPLYANENSVMFFADAQSGVFDIVKEIKAL